MTDPRPDDCVDLPYNVTWDKAACPKLEIPIGAQVCQPIGPPPPPPCQFDPDTYDWVRYRGVMVNSQNPVYTPGNYGANTGGALYEDGSILTGWQAVEKGTLAGGGLCVTSAYGRDTDTYRRFMGEIWNTDAGQIVQPEGTTTWSSPEVRKWRANIYVSSTGYQGVIAGNTLYIGCMCYTDSTESSKNYWQNPATGGEFGAGPFRATVNFNKDFLDGKQEYVSITGNFEFYKGASPPTDDNDLYIVTWGGLDDDGNYIDCPTPTPEPNPRPTPLPCPVDPSDYQWVRYVGNVTSSDMSRMNMKSDNSYDVWRSNQITTQWYSCPNETYPDTFLSLSGMWIKYGPHYAYTWGVADDAFDESSDRYTGTLDYSMGTNYEKMIVPATGQMPPWRSKYRVVVDHGDVPNYEAYSNLAFHQPHIGGIGGNLGIPNIIYNDHWSVTIDNSNTTEAFQGWYQLEGWWEFSNDKETVLGSWSGQDYDGNDIDCDPQPPSGCQELQTYGTLQYLDPYTNQWIDAYSGWNSQANMARKIISITYDGQIDAANWRSTCVFITISYVGDDPANEYNSYAKWEGAEDFAENMQWRLLPSTNNPCLDP